MMEEAAQALVHSRNPLEIKNAVVTLERALLENDATLTKPKIQPLIAEVIAKADEKRNRGTIILSKKSRRFIWNEDALRTEYDGSFFDDHEHSRANLRLNSDLSTAPGNGKVDYQLLALGRMVWRFEYKDKIARTECYRCTPIKYDDLSSAGWRYSVLSRWLVSRWLDEALDDHPV
ncbi:hypothetical protein DL98DRAFT_127946 [Cadophora sp. DSE1049]|nr:hypothetical protein DL98DRAFT_127946 [Cadophora sp. DSE1049]